ncbi:MAG: prepilin-type N-terminal cleavage/methylation domain-containing protein [Gammaproteobacteria bacterium]|nr:prepilin-type N-terminal cleavage/methylation domain-containing protein [Gammaproteobacteria bacterium]
MSPFSRGFSLIELLLAIAIGALVIAGLSGVLGRSLHTYHTVSEQNALTRDAQFAMQRIVRAVSHSRRLLLPLADNPNTNWPENIRAQTVPPSAPIGDSTLATAVLAVTLPAYIDLDFDGFPDADDDRDGLIDEDLPNDNHHDFEPGIMLIDDDGDGVVDDGTGWAEDDEDGAQNEDPLDGIDNDGDGSVDEDAPSDNNGDTCAGVCGVDDDGDGQVDEGAFDDDDEDGGSFDDPYDPVVFYLSGGALIERMPVPWNEDGISVPDGPVDGRDFVTHEIAANVTRFRVERIPQASGQPQLVDITLELTSPATGEMVSLQTQVRVGGAL